MQNDPRVIIIFERLEDMPQKMSKDQFYEVIEEHEGIVEKVLAKDFIMSDFATFRTEIKELFDLCKQNKSGANADYIPELANQNPDNWGVSITTVDGQ